jgi:hypothetical protein
MLKRSFFLSAVCLSASQPASNHTTTEEVVGNIDCCTHFLIFVLACMPCIN